MRFFVFFIFSLKFSILISRLLLANKLVCLAAKLLFIQISANFCCFWNYVNSCNHLNQTQNWKGRSWYKASEQLNKWILKHRNMIELKLAFLSEYFKHGALTSRQEFMVEHMNLKEKDQHHLHWWTFHVVYNLLT